MGGFGSGRWGYHRGKQTADESKRLAINTYSPSLRDIAKHNPGMTFTASTTVSWTNRFTGETVAAVLLKFDGNPSSVNAWLSYTTQTNSGEKVDHHYRIGLTYTLAPWGARRYWWTCPRCGHRCGVLYLPPGAARFACRSCYDLTYQSCLDSHKSHGFMNRLMAAAGIDMTGEEFDALINWEGKGLKGKPPKALQARLALLVEQRLAEYERERESALQAIRERIIAREERERAAKEAKYSRYLSPGDLCEQSSLTAEELAALAAARLLLPDREGKYRPKLAGWAGKLAYLLHAGWDIETIRRWAAERWHNPNPRAWPPDKAIYQSKAE